jgi:hypothetical protein
MSPRDYTTCASICANMRVFRAWTETRQTMEVILMTTVTPIHMRLAAQVNRSIQTSEKRIAVRPLALDHHGLLDSADSVAWAELATRAPGGWVQTRWEARAEPVVAFQARFPSPFSTRWATFHHLVAFLELLHPPASVESAVGVRWARYFPRICRTRCEMTQASAISRLPEMLERLDKGHFRERRMAPYELVTGSLMIYSTMPIQLHGVAPLRPRPCPRLIPFRAPPGR